MQIKFNSHICYISYMDYIIEKLIKEDELNNKVLQLASLINNKYKGRELIVICVLKGAFMFASDIIKNLIDVDVKVDFLIASSYNNGLDSSLNVKIVKDIDYDINDKDVLIIEDILDTGFTLSKVIEILNTRKPNNIEVLVLLNKVAKRKVEINCHYTGFNIDDYFVVGYGIDYAQKHRALPYIGKVIMK